MTVRSATLVFSIPCAQSLKDKRQVRRSLIDRARRRFNLSVAEVATQDACRTLTLGIALVSGDAGHAAASLDAVIRFFAENDAAELVSAAVD